MIAHAGRRGLLRSGIGGQIRVPVVRPVRAGVSGWRGVIRDETELAKRAGGTANITVPKALKVEGIDFKKQMLVVIEDGTQPMVGVSGGGPPSALYAVEVFRIDRIDDKNMTVHYRLVP